MKKDLNFKNYQIVFYDSEQQYDTRFQHGQRLYFLGEIPNAPMHCIVVDQNGKIYPMTAVQFLRHPAENEV